MRMELGRVFFALSALLVAWPSSAGAQDGGAPDGGVPWTPLCPLDHIGCHTEDVDFHHRDALFDDVMLDSGWVPAGSPLQVRFALFLGGSTEVDLGGTAVTSWPPALDVAVPGRPGTGRLAINYGLEIVARIRIDVEVAGVRYTWEGDIPIPGGIPRDLRLFDQSIFDPFVLPPSEPRPVTAWDDTDLVTVLDVDLTDALIPIPGIGGGFLVDAVGSLEGATRPTASEISDALTDITTEGESVVVRADPGAVELGAFKEYTVLPHGTIGYDGVITLFPAALRGDRGPAVRPHAGRDPAERGRSLGSDGVRARAGARAAAGRAGRADLARPRRGPRRRLGRAARHRLQRRRGRAVGAHGGPRGAVLGLLDQPDHPAVLLDAALGALLAHPARRRQRGARALDERP
ncbi:MAG: hypothetical protein M5U28_56760 [Sandaracinaceae bacterium]|nr:hypothetical protein [Sandaracinaceae bacterium]